MQLLFFLVIGALVAVARWALGAPLVSSASSSLVFCVIGLAGIAMALGHHFRGPWVAERIGWPTRNPFQQEVAAANLGLGVAGVVAPFLGTQAMWIASVMYAVFYWGCGATHVIDARRRDNHAPFNGGLQVTLTFILPVLVFLLLVART